MKTLLSLIQLLVFLPAMWAQTIVPLSAVCKPGLVTIATQTGTLGLSAIVKLSCVKLDISVITDVTTTPPTLKAKAGAGGNPVPLMVLVPGGFSAAPDGVATVFTIPNAHAYSTLQIYDNGKLLTPIFDYNVQQVDAGIQITFTAAPAAGDIFQVFYYELQFVPGAAMFFVCVEGVCDVHHESGL